MAVDHPPHPRRSSRKIRRAASSSSPFVSALDGVGAAEGIDGPWWPTLMGNDLLRAERRVRPRPRVGSASASSMRLVCRELAPPSTAARRLRRWSGRRCCTRAVRRTARRRLSGRGSGSSQRPFVARAEAIAHGVRPDPPCRAHTWRSPRESRCGCRRRTTIGGAKLSTSSAGVDTRLRRTQDRHARVNANSCRAVAPGRGCGTR